MSSVRHCISSKTALLSLLLIAGVLGVAGLLGTTSGPQTVVGEEPKATAPSGAATSHAKELSKAFRGAAEVAMPTVVRIQSKTNAKEISHKDGDRRMNPGDRFKGTPFEDFFKNMPDLGGDFEGKRPGREGVGSGVIIDKSGIVLTNNHVVDGADEVTVRLSDGREFKATDIKTDPQSDLAVLKIKSNETFPAATLGDSDKLDIGDWVIAIGTPFELDQTVSAGIISAKGRELSEGRHARGSNKMLQTDAAINPGNSGGPLVNLDGEVIGINTAIATNTGSFEGIGFAIPSNQAKWITAQLMKDGSVHRAYLGVGIGEVSQELAEKFGIHRHEGVLVSEVFPNTPAADAGVQEGDVIVSFNKQKVQSPRDLQELVERVPLDSKQSLEVIRDGKPQTLTMLAKVMPEKYGMSERPNVQEREEPARGNTYHDKDLGLIVADLTEADAQEHNYKGFSGVIIVKVDPDSIAASKYLAEGMLIRKVGKTPVHDVKSFEEAVKKESLKEGVLLQVREERGNHFVVLQAS